MKATALLVLLIEFYIFIAYSLLKEKKSFLQLLQHKIRTGESSFVRGKKGGV